MDVLESPKKYPYSFTEQSVVDQEDLKRVQEGIKLTSEVDPFGKVDNAVFYFVGDSHISSDDPKKEPTVMMQPYATISRLDLRNPKRYTEKRPTRFDSTWFAEVEELRVQMERDRPLLEQGYVPIVIHLGDMGSDAEMIGDMQNAFLTVGEGLMSMDGAKVAMLPGDHEFDKKRHGNQVRDTEMELLGDQGWFCQRVGGKHLLIGLTSSLLGDGDGDDENITKWRQRQNEMLSRAKQICETEGRGVVLAGHKMDELEAVAAERGLRVEAIFSGHKHKGDVQDRGGVVVGTVGAPTVGAFGLEIDIKPSIIKLIVDGEVPVEKRSVSQLVVDPKKIEGLM